MLGFGNKREKAVDEAERYLRSMFAGLGNEDGTAVPEEVYRDPYVVGFLQVLARHAAANIYMSRMPDDDGLADILATALDRRSPGSGATMRSALAMLAPPEHPRHDDYLGGRHDGSEHVRTFFTNDGIGRNNIHQRFRDHVTRHYL